MPFGLSNQTHVLGVVVSKGMPMFKNPMAKGDLYLKLNIQMPKAEDLKNDKVSV